MAEVTNEYTWRMVWFRLPGDSWVVTYVLEKLTPPTKRQETESQS